MALLLNQIVQPITEKRGYIQKDKKLSKQFSKSLRKKENHWIALTISFCLFIGRRNWTRVRSTSFEQTSRIVSRWILSTCSITFLQKASHLIIESYNCIFPVHSYAENPSEAFFLHNEEQDILFYSIKVNYISKSMLESSCLNGYH